MREEDRMGEWDREGVREVKKRDLGVSRRQRMWKERGETERDGETDE